MSEGYKKTLTIDEYTAVYRLGEIFEGSEVARISATKINEKINKGVNELSTKTPALDEKKNPILDDNGEPKIEVTPPAKLDIVFTRVELDGYFIGVKDTLRRDNIKSGDISVISLVCKSLGMSNRFTNYINSVLGAVELNKEPLDEEVVTDPLD